MGVRPGRAKFPGPCLTGTWSSHSAENDRGGLVESHFCQTIFFSKKSAGSFFFQKTHNDLLQPRRASHSTKSNMHSALVILCLFGAVSALGSPFDMRPQRIDMSSLLLELNMTMDQLFPPLLNASDFVYTYSQSAAHFTGPGIDVYGCSGLQGVSCPGAGICRNNPVQFRVSTQTDISTIDSILVTLDFIVR